MATHSARRSHARAFRLHVESLECRCVPTGTSTWIGLLAAPTAPPLAQLVPANVEPVLGPLVSTATLQVVTQTGDSSGAELTGAISSGDLLSQVTMDGSPGSTDAGSTGTDSSSDSGSNSDSGSTSNSDNGNSIGSDGTTVNTGTETGSSADATSGSDSGSTLSSSDNTTLGSNTLLNTGTIASGTTPVSDTISATGIGDGTVVTDPALISVSAIIPVSLGNNGNQDNGNQSGGDNGGDTSGDNSDQHTDGDNTGNLTTTNSTSSASSTALLPSQSVSAPAQTAAAPAGNGGVPGPNPGPTNQSTTITPPGNSGQDSALPSQPKAPDTPKPAPDNADISQALAQASSTRHAQFIAIETEVHATANIARYLDAAEGVGPAMEAKAEAFRGNFAVLQELPTQPGSDENPVALSETEQAGVDTSEVATLTPASPSRTEALVGATTASFDLQTLQQGVLGFFAKLDQINEQIVAVQQRTGVPAWIVGLVTTGVALEFARRRFGTRGGTPELAGVGASQAWTWIVNPTDPFSLEE